MMTISELIRMIESDMENRSAYSIDALLDGRSVTVQTMHKSKGLEYPIVIIGGINKKVMPRDDVNVYGNAPVMVFDPLYGIRMTCEYSIIGEHHKTFTCRKWAVIKSARGSDWNGERRVFFVALSRAKQYITMTCYGNQGSQFIKDIGETPVDDAEPDLSAVAAAVTRTEPIDPPAPEMYERRKKRIPLHEIMGQYEESGGGKGTEHGIQVHKAAERIMNGLEPYKECEETAYLRTIYERVKNAKILTEVDCTYPIRDAVIAGRIDMLAEFDDRVEIHDYKTDMNRKNEDRYAIQLSVYGHAAASLGKPVKLIIDYVSQNESVPVEPVSEEEIYERVVLRELKGPGKEHTEE